MEVAALWGGMEGRSEKLVWAQKAIKQIAEKRNPLRAGEPRAGGSAVSSPHE